MTHGEILDWLQEQDERRLETLWRRADGVRRESVGDAVHLRGLLEVSNHCVRRCAYCGLNADNPRPSRYRLTAEQTIECARQAADFGYGTVVIQGGEDYGISQDWMAGVIRRIKRETPLAVTLSLGERPGGDLAAWRDAGADRYLLRFETSDRTLYRHIHPPLDGRPSDRIRILRQLAELGYEVGSGVMVGIPGQTCSSLARDIELFRELELDMIGLGPYLPHPGTPLGRQTADAVAGQVPNTELMTCKVLALTRITCPLANIPSTTALATVNTDSGRELGLARGANVVMPNVTPPQYRALYEIYPSKAGTGETARQTREQAVLRIAGIGRTVGTGRGDSPRRAGITTV